MSIVPKQRLRSIGGGKSVSEMADPLSEFITEKPLEVVVEQPILPKVENVIAVPPQTPNEPAKAPPVSTAIVVLGAIGSIVSGLFQIAYWTLRATFRYLRHHPIHALLTILLIGSLALVIGTGAELHDRVILSEISEHTVNEIIAASKYTRDFRSTNLPQRGTEEFLRVGAPEWVQRESVRALLFNARKADLSIEDQAALLAIVEVESGFNPVAKAPTTSACGLFQFVKATGLAFGLSPEDCMDPWQNTRAGIRHYMEHFENSIQRQVDKLEGSEKIFRMFELSYYIHHDGPGVTSSSNDVKATILSGTQFLFRVYALLKEEQASRERAPTFSQLFAKNVARIWRAITRDLASYSDMAISKIH